MTMILDQIILIKAFEIKVKFVIMIEKERKGKEKKKVNFFYI